MIRLRFQITQQNHKVQITPWPQVKVFRQATTFPDHARAFLQECLRQDQYSPLRFKTWAINLITDLLRFESSEATTPRLSQSQINLLFNEVHEVDYLWPSPPELAAALKLSHPYFSQIFRDSLGVTPRRWLVQQRISRACELLTQPELSISQIADRLGYESHHLFSRQFKQIMHIPPTTYRRLD